MAATSERGFLRQAWQLTWPYWKSEEKWSAIGLLVAVVALNLFSVWLNVRLNRWNNDFYNALQQYNWSEFWYQFGIFGTIAFAMIVDAVYALYLRQILHIRWRRWLTDRYLRQLARRPELLPHAVEPGGDGQPGPAHLGRHRQFRDDDDRAVDRPVERLCHVVVVSDDPVGAVGRADDPARRR